MQPGNRLQTPILIGCKFLMILTWLSSFHYLTASLAVISWASNYMPDFTSVSNNFEVFSLWTRFSRSQGENINACLGSWAPKTCTNDCPLHRGKKKPSQSSDQLGVSCCKSLTMSYFHTGIRTIIGAKSFHCPVRDGKEWYQLAMVIRHNLLTNCSNEQFIEFIEIKSAQFRFYTAA